MTTATLVNATWMPRRPGAADQTAPAEGQQQRHAGHHGRDGDGQVDQRVDELATAKGTARQDVGQWRSEENAHRRSHHCCLNGQGERLQRLCGEEMSSQVLRRRRQWKRDQRKNNVKRKN